MNVRHKLVGTYFGARAAANAAITRMGRMPLVLRLICLASLGTGLGFLVVNIFQVGSIRVNGDTLSWAEARAAGYYPFFILSELFLVVAGAGLWMRRRCSRWLVILLYLVVSPIEIIYWRSHPRIGSGTPWNYCVSAVIWAGFFYWYLCHKQKAFFAAAAARPNGHS
jgi:hypothetical protein